MVLAHYKQLSIDIWNIQQSVIRNYLWLALSFIAAYIAFYWKIIELGVVLSDRCPLIMLVLAVSFAGCALVIGIRSMTGNSVQDPVDKYVDYFNYLTSKGYDQGNHYALLENEIKNIKKSIDDANKLIDRRGGFMRMMNFSLILSTSFGVLSVFLYYLSIL